MVGFLTHFLNISVGKTYLDFLGVAGVPGGVTPLPLARLSPITLTSSLTDTPINSGGISLLTEAAAAEATEAAEAILDLVGLCDPGLFMASPLNHFYRRQENGVFIHGVLIYKLSFPFTKYTQLFFYRGFNTKLTW